MPEKISELFHIRNRFLRSAHLERHFQDPSAFSGYVMTDFARSCLARMADGLKPRSGQRACDRQRSQRLYARRRVCLDRQYLGRPLRSAVLRGI